MEIRNLDSAQINEITTALIASRPNFKVIAKTATNPHFKSKYAPLDTILDAVTEPLLANGLYISQAVDGDELVTRIIHKGGQFIGSRYPIRPTSRGSEPTPQDMASALTYARRYSLSALLGVASEDDDDGNSASQSKPPKQAAPKPQAPETPPAPVEKVSQKTCDAILKLVDGAVVTNEFLDKTIVYYKQTRLQDVTATQAQKILDRLTQLHAEAGASK